MVQAKDAMRMGGVFKTFMVIAMFFAVIFSGVAMYNSSQEVRVEIPAGLSADEVRAIVEEEFDGFNVSIPEVVIPDMDNQRLDDVYNKVYATEIAELEDAGLAAYDVEFNEDDFEDALEDLIEDFDKLKDVDLEETDVEVLNLGLEDEEDRLVRVVREYDIKYEDTEDDDNVKETVIVTGTITYDEDDGYEAELEYSLA